MPTPKMTEGEQRAYDEALKRIEECRGAWKWGTGLNLHGLGLTAFPPEIVQLTALTVLKLGGNRLTSLPPEIGQLTALKDLYLYDNQLTSLPPEIGQLTALTRLHLYGNRLTSLPPEIRQFTALMSLDLHDNQLKSLPPEIGHLTALMSLDLHDNQLTSLPPEFGQLTALTGLYLNDNQLTILPPEIGQLTALKDLYLYDNHLTSLPPEFGQLTALTGLYLNDNRLTSLPPEIGQLTALKALVLNRNPLTFPPPEVVAQGKDAVLAFLRAAKKDVERKWESKLLIVGEGAVGKTWLLEALNGRLNGGQRPDKAVTTLGVEIGELVVAHPSEAQTMRLRAWDFAGQTFNHAPHQLYFSDEALFVVVWSARAGFENGRVWEWLQNIKDRAPKATVLVVAAQWDQQQPPYPKARLLADYPQVRAVVEASSTSGLGIAELKTLIADHAAGLPLMGETWPATWLRGAEELRKLRERRVYLELHDVLSALASCKVAATEAKVLLTWLHGLGEVLWFREVAALRDWVALDPQWVTRHMGLVLADQAVQKAKGVLTRDRLAELWPELNWPERDFLLALMECYDLAYTIPDTECDRSLVVERLPQDPPPNWLPRWAQFPAETTLRVRYYFPELKALHPGIPTWFFARCHRFTLGCHWSGGVLFGDVTEGAPEERQPRHIARITAANDGVPRVEFTVRGPLPYNHLTRLRDGFEATLGRYENLVKSVRVPCPTKEGTPEACVGEWDIVDLENRLQRKKGGIECLKCSEDHSIMELLYGVSSAPVTLDDRLGRMEAQIGQVIEIIPADGDRTRAAVEATRAELEAARTELVARLDDTVGQVRLELVRAFNYEQRNADLACPSVFAMFPVDGPTLLRAKVMRLQLYCMCDRGWHSLGEAGACQFDVPPNWLVFAAGFFAKWGKILKPLLALATPVAGAALAAVGFEKAASEGLKELAESAKALTELGTEVAEKSRAAHRDEEGAEWLATAGGSGVRPVLRGSDLSALRMLFRMDGVKFKGGEFAGLTKRMTKEEHILWLCPQHAQEITGQR